jgi:hypothetical protein
MSRNPSHSPSSRYISVTQRKTQRSLVTILMAASNPGDSILNFSRHNQRKKMVQRSYLEQYFFDMSGSAQYAEARNQSGRHSIA